MESKARWEELDEAPLSRIRRVPRGYRGIRHETIGSDILALPDAILMPEALLGRERLTRLMRVDRDRWYPIEDLLEAFEHLDGRLGPESMRKVGYSLFALSHESAVRAVCRTARHVLHGLDGMYHRANRGDAIGGWRVLAYDDRQALLEKTTPHHCVVEEGILEAALRAIGVPATIHQTVCFRKGADACRFVVSSRVSAERWHGSGR